MTERQKTALVCGAGGFIGGHMVRRLKAEGYWVRGVDIKRPEYSQTAADEFIIGDLTDIKFVERVTKFSGYQGNFYYSTPEAMKEPFDEIYQYAADMGGAGYIFSGENDSEVMFNSATINLNILRCQQLLNKQKETNKTKIFYSSSACMYPEYAQEETCLLYTSDAADE